MGEEATKARPHDRPLERITGTLAWAPYSVLLGEHHTVSSQLEGLFLSLYSTAVGRKAHIKDTSIAAWAAARCACFAGRDLSHVEHMPEPLRPLINKLHALFWPLDQGEISRTYHQHVTVEQFCDAVSDAVPGVRAPTTVVDTAAAAAAAAAQQEEGPCAQAAAAVGATAAGQ